MGRKGAFGFNIRLLEPADGPLRGNDVTQNIGAACDGGKRDWPLRVTQTDQRFNECERVRKEVRRLAG